MQELRAAECLDLADSSLCKTRSRPSSASNVTRDAVGFVADGLRHGAACCAGDTPAGLLALRRGNGLRGRGPAGVAGPCRAAAACKTPYTEVGGHGGGPYVAVRSTAVPYTVSMTGAAA